MNRLSAATTAALLAAALALPASAAAASNSATTSIPADTGLIEMHITANCVTAEGRCTFDTQADLLAPDGPTGFPGDAWARQTITLRSMNRDVAQEAQYSAPSGNPPQTKGSNYDNVLSKLYKSVNNAQISVTYFGGGPMERFHVDGSSVPTNWSDGQPAIAANFIACSEIQVVYSGVNLTSPTACATTTFS